MTDARPGSIPDGVLRLPARPRHGHKGTFGQVLLVGGSRGFGGAIGLAGMSALRGGAGLVRLAIPDPCLEVVASYEPSYMTVPLASDGAGRIAASALDRLRELAAASTVVACGPGLGRSTQLDQLVATLYAETEAPLVCDADALNALSVAPDQLPRHAGPRILTPHPGEFARLSGVSARDPEGQARAAAELADSADLIVVLKGHRSLVAAPRSTWRNSSGNPGMATGGSGDVLTGLLAAFLGLSYVGWTLPEAVRTAVYAHGLAGDLAAGELGETALIASDLIRFLPAALRRLEAPRAEGSDA